MKKTIFIFTLVLMSLSMHGQDTGYEIIGTAVDNFTGEFVDSCTITLYSSDTTTVISQTKNAKWGFLLPVDRSGRYVVKYEAPTHYPIYKTIKASFIKYRKSDMLLDEVKMQKKPKMRMLDLPEVTVEATKVKMVMKGDTIVYNADAFELANGSMLDALVSQLPGVELRGGSIYVNGEHVDNLIVNGRDFFKGNPRIALENLPAYMVNKIKVYRKESDINEALGIVSPTKEDKELVMDVNLKRIYSFGWTANVDGGIGTDNRYQGKLFGLRFSNYTRSVLFANSNNTNNASIPGTDGNWGTHYQLSSPADYTAGGLMHQIDDRQGRFKYEGNATIDYLKTDNRTFTAKEQFMNDGNTFSHQRSLATDKHTHFKTYHKLTLQKKGSQRYISMAGNLEYTDQKNNSAAYLANLYALPEETGLGSFLDSVFFATDKEAYQEKLLMSTQRLQQAMNGYRWDGKVEGDMAFRLGGSYDIFNIRVSGDFSNGKRRGTDLNSIHYLKEDERQEKSLCSDEPFNSHNYSLHAEYNMNWRKRPVWLVRFAPSYTFSAHHSHAPRTIYDLGNDVENAVAAVDTYNSLRSTSDDYIHHIRLALNGNRTLESGNNISGNLLISPSLHQRSLDYERSYIDTVAKKDILLWNGHVQLTYERPQKDEMLSLSYNYIQNAPGLVDLMPFRDDVNPLLVSKGNTALRNSANHDVQLIFNRMDWANGKQLRVMALYTYMQDHITRAVLFDKNTGVTTVSPMNIDGSQRIAASASYNCPITRNRRFRFGGSATVSHSLSKEFVNDLQKVDNSSARTSANFTYEKGKYLITLGGAFNYNHIASARDGFNTLDLMDFSYGVNGKMPLPFGFELSGDMKMYSRRGYTAGDMNTDQLICNMQLSKSVLNDKLLFRLVGYDLLGNIDNVTRTINAYGRTENMQNILTRYVMLNVSYKFHKQPKKR